MYSRSILENSKSLHKKGPGHATSPVDFDRSGSEDDELKMPYKGSKGSKVSKGKRKKSKKGSKKKLNENSSTEDDEDEDYNE
jgi:hypothetical protein